MFECFTFTKGGVASPFQFSSNEVSTGWAGWGWCALVVQHSFCQTHMAVTPHLHFLTTMQSLNHFSEEN